MRGHMVQHLLIGMFAPIFLVLGAPITLALKAFPVQVARRITTLMKSRFFQIVSHPVTALILNMGGMYVLYLTPLYNESFNNSYLHHMIHIHFLVAGYLFTWSIIGLDPVPQRPGLQIRVFALFISIAAHAFLSKLMYAYLLPLNSPHPDHQIREGAQWMYYGGDLSELFLTLVLFATWYQHRGRSKYGIFPMQKGERTFYQPAKK
jgi:putative membrane protein